MKQTRKKHSPALKDKVALAALQGEQTIVESGTFFQTSNYAQCGNYDRTDS